MKDWGVLLWVVSLGEGLRCDVMGGVLVYAGVWQCSVPMCDERCDA